MKKIIMSLMALIISVAVFAQTDTKDMVTQTPDEYAAQVKENMTSRYSLTAEQASEVYNIAKKTADQLQQLETAMGSQRDKTVYDKKKATILKYGDVYLRRALNRDQLVQYSKDKTLALKPQRMRERREAAAKFNETKEN